MAVISVKMSLLLPPVLGLSPDAAAAESGKKPRLEANAGPPLATAVPKPTPREAGRGPSVGAVQVTPSTRPYYCADSGAGQTTYRRKGLRKVRIGGVTAMEGRAFGAVSLDIIRPQSNREAAACPKDRANQRVSPPVALPCLLGNAKDVFARQRLLTRCVPKRNSVVAQRLKLSLVRFDVVHYDPNFPTRRQGTEIAPTAC